MNGPIDAVERSPIFASRLAATTKRDGFGAGRIWRTHLLDAPLPRNTYDLIFARYRAARLRVTAIHPTIKTGRPGSAVWRWLTTYFMTVMRRYAQFAPFDASEAARVRRHWTRASRDRTSLPIAPAVLDVVGRKRR